MRVNTLFVVVSLLLASLLLWSLKGIGDWYSMHDSTHIERVNLMVSTWRTGQIPAIWAYDANDGLGYPLFHFYAPLFHTLAALLTLVLGSALISLKVVLFLITFGGTLGVMIFASRWGRVASLIAAVAFALSPYLALSLYVRGSYSEYLALMIMPWVLLSTTIIRTPTHSVLAAIALSLFLLSHNLIPVLALPLIVVWVLYHNSKHLKLTLITGLLTLLLSAWFILPLIFERHFTVADQVAKTTSYALHYLEPWQIWDSTWGFGGSAAGVEDGMSFKLGKLQLLLAGLGILFAIVKKSRPLMLLASFAVFYGWLTTASSSWLWDSLPLLQVVQFPWRSLGLIALLLAILSGYFISRIPFKPLRVLTTVSLALVLLFLNLKYFIPSSILKNPVPTQDIAEIVPEFTPVWLTRNNIFIVGSTVLPYAYYPTWEVVLDGVKVPTYPSADGRLAFNNPGGSLDYRARQSHTPLQKFSYALTLTTITVLFVASRRGKYVKA